MYPQAELTILAARKEILLLRIATRRAQCAAEARRLTKPLGWIDQALAKWQALGPATRLIGAPAGLFVLRSLLRHYGKGKWIVVAQMIRMALRGVKLFR